MNIHFEKAAFKYEETIFMWLSEPHMQEFWDNSQEHKDDIINFMQGRKVTSNYFNGVFSYWVGSIDSTPFCFILTGAIRQEDTDDPLWRENISTTGNTYTIDFGIGNTNYLGKGLAAPTLRKFVTFFKSDVDKMADTFFIDPDENNPRAKHVYEKSGFKSVGDFTPQEGAFKDQTSHLMVLKLSQCSTFG